MFMIVWDRLQVIISLIAKSAQALGHGWNLLFKLLGLTQILVPKTC